MLTFNRGKTKIINKNLKERAYTAVRGLLIKNEATVIPPIQSNPYQSMNASNPCPTLDWAGWLPGTCQVGRLVRLPGGPPRKMFKEE